MLFSLNLTEFVEIKKKFGITYCSLISLNVYCPDLTLYNYTFKRQEIKKLKKFIFKQSLSRAGKEKLHAILYRGFENEISHSHLNN